MNKNNGNARIDRMIEKLDACITDEMSGLIQLQELLKKLDAQDKEELDKILEEAVKNAKKN